MLSSDLLNRLMPVVRSFGSPEHFTLQLLEPITFFNLHIQLLSFTSRYRGLDPKIKTNLFVVLLFFFEILFVDVARDFQIIAICFLDQVGIC